MRNLPSKALTHSSQRSADAESVDGAADSEFKPLTAEEARQWRARNAPMSPWRVVAWQLMVGVVLAVLVGVSFGGSAGVLAAYGALAVVAPAALMARGLSRQSAIAQPGALMLGFVVWESVKVLLTVVLLLAAPKVLSPLNWLALVAGFVVTMKVYWVAVWLHSRNRSLNVLN